MQGAALAVGCNLGCKNDICVIFFHYPRLGYKIDEKGMLIIFACLGHCSFDVSHEDLDEGAKTVMRVLASSK